MKILLYSLNYSPEQVGIGKYSGEMAQWLKDRGHQLNVLTAQPYYPTWHIEDGYRNRYKMEQAEGLRVYRCPLWVPRKPNGLSRLLHLASFAVSSLPLLISKFWWRPEIVICIAPAFFCAPGALLLGKLCGKQTTTWLHIQDFELDAAFELGILKGHVLRSIAISLERSTLRRFNRVSSISSAMVKRLKAKGVDPSRSLLVRNWVDLESIFPQVGTERRENPYRQELGISSNQLLLMYSGSMNKKQGLDVLAGVIKKLADVPNLVWLLAGEGPTKNELIAATQDFHNVHHFPLQPVERLNDWLNAADIHLLPQKAEAADLVLPSKLLGILASGRPLVASSPAESELAEFAKQAGACVTPGDIDGFATAIRELISSEHHRNESGKRARKLAEQYFGIHTVLNSFEQQLGDLIAKADMHVDTY